MLKHKTFKPKKFWQLGSLLDYCIVCSTLLFVRQYHVKGVLMKETFCTGCRKRRTVAYH